MLVLTRQRDETIMIGDDVEVTVVDIRGDKVRIGINAPTSIAVHRKEIYDAIKRENEQAARLDAAGFAERGSRMAVRGPKGASVTAHSHPLPSSTGTAGCGSAVIVTQPRTPNPRTRASNPAA